MNEIKSRVDNLRNELKNYKIDGFIVPHEDEFQSEIVPTEAERLSFISGFTGSAGIAIILKDKAVLFIDGRYTLQAPKQTNTEIFEVINIADKKPYEWLAENTNKNTIIGYDSWLHTPNQIEKIKQECCAELLEIKDNLVDKIWLNKPTPMCNKVFPHPLEYSGLESENKIKSISEELKEKNIYALLINDLASSAWLLNIRGKDVENSPLVHCLTILYQDKNIDLIINPKKIDDKTKEFLGSNVKIIDIKNTVEHISKRLKDKSVLIDKNAIPIKLYNTLNNNKSNIIEGLNPCELPKAIKNNIEIQGAIEAHKRDAVAMIKFLSWFDEATKKENSVLTEISIANKLEKFRAESPLFRGNSFETISACGSNGAIVHYKATEETNKTLEKNSLLLLDSGGQYLDGTTDITRTILIGKPTKEQKQHYTLVLKGNIAIDTLRFPEGTSGCLIDSFARQFLWQNGLDYEHGTGHGIGSYLNVHEAPQAISKSNNFPLSAGMLLSNEPGYYKTNKYGIRLENVVLIEQLGEMENAKKLLGFKTLTLVPFDKRLIVKSLLTKKETEWLNDYHHKIYEEISKYLENKTLAWLKEATKPI